MIQGVYICTSNIHTKFQPSNSIIKDFTISSRRFDFRIFNFLQELNIAKYVNFRVKSLKSLKGADIEKIG